MRVKVMHRTYTFEISKLPRANGFARAVLHAAYAKTRITYFTLFAEHSGVVQKTTDIAEKTRFECANFARIACTCVCVVGAL